MKLNWLEKLAVNSPLWSFAERRLIAPPLERMGGRLEGQRVLDVGCGSGVGTEIILERFGVREVHAFDLDPDMVARARIRLARFPTSRLTLAAGDATAIGAKDDAFDAAFDFAIIHHVPDWQRALGEIRRVLRPGGRFFFLEVTRVVLDSWFFRAFTVHPQLNRFSAGEFLAELERQRFVIGSSYAEHWHGAIILGVGTCAK